MFPALLAFGSCDALRASGLADLGRSEEALATLAAALGWTREAAWRALALLPRMRELTLLILLVCPGAPPSALNTLGRQHAHAGELLQHVDAWAEQGPRSKRRHVSCCAPRQVR